MKDNVNHPDHYKSSSGLEAIDVIEAFTSELSGLEAVCTGNALKYILRWKKKNGVEDLKKARWYLNRLIKNLESDNPETKSDRYDRKIRFEFSNRSRAEAVLQNLINSMSLCPYLTVATAYVIAGFMYRPGDNDYGWYDLTGLEVTSELDHYVISFPQPTKIKRNN